jgi:hypothetical protein
MSIRQRNVLSISGCGTDTPVGQMVDIGKCLNYLFVGNEIDILLFL